MPHPLTRRFVLGAGLAGLAGAALAEAPLSTLRPRPRPGPPARTAGPRRNRPSVRRRGPRSTT